MTKTKNQTRTTKTGGIIAMIILGVAIAVAPLIHISLPKINSYVEAYKKELYLPVQKMESALAELKSEYNAGELSAEQYLSQYDILAEKISSIEEQNNKLVDLKVDEERIFGFKTWRSFWIAFGVRIPFLFLSIMISIIIIIWVKPETSRLKLTFGLIQLFTYSISFWLVTWVFWPAQDYPIKTYWIAMLVGSTLLASGLVTFLMWYRFKIERLESISRNVIAFTYKIEQVGKYIVPDKLWNYRKERTELINESLENE